MDFKLFAITTDRPQRDFHSVHLELILDLINFISIYTSVSLKSAVRKSLSSITSKIRSSGKRYAPFLFFRVKILIFDFSMILYRFSP